MSENIVGLIAFSQGTILNTMIGHLAMKVPKLREKLKFMVFFSGNGIKPPAEYSDQIKLITIPSFHTIQTRDWLQTETLMQTILFENPETVTVNQGTLCQNSSSSNPYP